MSCFTKNKHDLYHEFKIIFITFLYSIYNNYIMNTYAYRKRSEAITINYDIIILNIALFNI
jgi:hypothetical protein